ncbi:hypothetical protein SGFS_017460 [Streptomyces graminofaciens]|uniref:Transposase n=1 Tax=Streptomyces graminofaciens TaxID=68212 RepID=A0ABM7F3V4_9ACTN|nr:hypothetical protein SGFS_017460 [Streptomyces graminofaciens]
MISRLGAVLCPSSGPDAADGKPFHAIEQRQVSQCRNRKELAAEYRLVIWEPQSREPVCRGCEPQGAALAQATFARVTTARRRSSAACLFRQMM